MPITKRVVYHILWVNHCWNVRLGGEKISVYTTGNKEDAITKGRALCKKQKLSQLVIHNQDGKIGKEYTYGKDPVRYKG